MKRIIFLIIAWTLTVPINIVSMETLPLTAGERLRENIHSEEKEPQVTLMAVGDVLLDKGIAEGISRHGTGYPLANVAGTFAQADIVLANLECPISDRGRPARKRSAFRAKPSYVDVLKKGGIDVVSLANNRIFDYGPVALMDTIKILDNAGIKHVGAGRNSKEAHMPLIVEKNGLRIAFLSYRGFVSYTGRYTRRSPCSARADFYLEEEVRNAKKEADVVIASFHGGSALSDTPSITQRKLAHRAIRGGADIVLWHHPHVLQGIERYRGKLIFYSLGNFLFISPDPKTLDTIILKLHLSKDGVVDHHIIPVRIDGLRPRLADKTESDSIIARLEEVSRGLTELSSDKKLSIIK